MSTGHSVWEGGSHPLAPRPHGTGRRFFDTKADAERWVQSFTPESKLAEEQWSQLTVVERARVIGTWREITNAGLTVDKVWEAYQEVIGVCAPFPLGKAIEALIESKRAGNKRPSYLKNLESMLNQFAQGREALSIAAIRTADIEAWLDEVSCSTEETEGDTRGVTCQGNIIATYGAEDRQLTLEGRVYQVVLEGGEWRMCGYQ